VSLSILSSFLAFWCLLPKGGKIRGVNNFSTICVAVGASCHIR
jgi:hypothetical protein